MKKKILLTTIISILVSQTSIANDESGSTPERTILPPQSIILLPPVSDDRGMNFNRAQREEGILSEDEIKAFRDFLLKRETAAHEAKVPTMRTGTKMVSLAPGSQIPVIEISPNYVASIVIVDSMGKPWPIVGHTNGADHVFQTLIPSTDPFNVISVAALMNVGASNISVLLEGQTVPLIIQLQVNREAMDIRSDMILSEIGPRSAGISMQAANIPSSTPDSTMMAFVDGVPPSGAVNLTVSDGRFRVWEFNDQLYIRTGLHISSPSFNQISHGTGGVRVYRMNKTPMILFSDSGRIGTLRITLPNLRTASSK